MKWVDREFNFDLPVTESSRLIERLRSTPDELEALVLSLPWELLIRRDGNAWSIQENAGHLLSIESLFRGRLDDYRANLETLRPADMTNRRTVEACHNESDIRDILVEFRRQREELLRCLEEFGPDGFAKSAMHPRLGKRMRVCDMMYFQAEHDRHHLSRIRNLMRQFGARSSSS
ncbi:MAG: DinB family protein [Candidatus Eiseniibacteriota bacterium]|nr:MAG: DinB family protein [Candidatus Eisenbacteria bacterium]